MLLFLKFFLLLLDLVVTLGNGEHRIGVVHLLGILKTAVKQFCGNLYKTEQVLRLPDVLVACQRAFASVTHILENDAFQIVGVLQLLDYVLVELGGV